MGERPLRGTVVGIVAPQPSADQLAAHLMRSLRSRRPDLAFVGIGGPNMEAAGAELLFPMDAVSAGGGGAGLSRSWAIAGVRRQVMERLLRERAALFVGVDASDFNLDLASDLKRSGMPTVQYGAPAPTSSPRALVGRVKQAASLLLTSFPHQTRAYSGAGIPLAYVGHPLADLLTDLPSADAVREELRVPLSAPVIALLPGSRAREVESTAELFLRTATEVAEQLPEARFLVPFVTRETKLVFEAALARLHPEALKLTPLIGHSLEAMAAADTVLVGPGTASLEAALLKRPMVIVSAARERSWWGAKRRTTRGLAGTPNILADEQIVPELGRDEATPGKLTAALLGLLNDSTARVRLDARFEAIRTTLRQNAHEKIAVAVMPLLARVRGA